MMKRPLLAVLYVLLGGVVCRGEIREIELPGPEGVNFWTSQTAPRAQRCDGRDSFVIDFAGTETGIGPVAPLELPGRPVKVGMWIHNDGRKIGSRVFVVGSDGENDGYFLPPGQWTGWKYVEIPLTSEYLKYTYFCFGEADGRPEPPVYLEGIGFFIEGGGKGTIHVGPIKVLCEVSPRDLIYLDIRSTKPFNSFRPGEPISFYPRITNLGDRDRAIELKYVIRDFFAKTLKEGSIPLHADPGRTAATRIEVGSIAERGYFSLTCTAVEDNATPAKRTTGFAVFEPQQKRGFNDDSPFAISRGWSGPLAPLTAVGVDWIRPGAVFTWSGIEARKGSFEWGRTDDYLADMDKNHLRFMAWMIDLPAWATQKDSPLPKDLADWSNYVYQLVSRYKGRILAWELDNEPNNHPDDWTPARYAAFLKATYPALKKADPAAKLVGIVTCRTDLGYIESVFKAGGFKYLDVVSVHPYRDPLSPEKTDFEGEMRRLAGLIDRFGGGKEIWLTEIGWGTGSNSRGIDEVTQANYVARMYVQALAAKYVKRVFYFYCADISPSKTNYEHNWGLLSYGYIPKPSYMAYDTLSRTLRTARFVTKLDLGSNLYGYTFADAGKEITVVWSAKGTQPVSLDVGTGEVRFLDLMGNELHPNRNKSAAIISLGESPMFIERRSGQRAIAGTPIISLHLPETIRSSVILRAEVTNIYDFPLQGSLTPTVPAGWQASPAQIPVQIGTGSRETYRFHIIPCAGPNQPHTVGLNLDVHHHGLHRVESRMDALTNIPFPSRKTLAPPRIDGDLGEWKNVPATHWRLSDRLAVDCYSLWDKTALYFAARVHDARLDVTDPERFWNNDCLELFLDLGHEKTVQAYDSNDHQFWFLPAGGKGNAPIAGESVWDGGTVKKTIPNVAGVQVASKITNDGYILETRISAAALGGYAPAPGKEIGFDLKLDEPSDPSIGETYWGSGQAIGAAVYQDPSRWGNLLFN